MVERSEYHRLHKRPDARPRSLKMRPNAIRYLLVGYVLIPLVINSLVNAVLGWLTFATLGSVSTWGWDKSAFADTIGTCFFLPFITCLIVTPIVRYEMASLGSGQRSHASPPRWMRMMARSILMRATTFGIITLLVLSGPVYISYAMFAPDEIASLHFVKMKVAFAAVLGIFVTPLIAWVAMNDQSESSQ